MSRLGHEATKTLTPTRVCSTLNSGSYRQNVRSWGMSGRASYAAELLKLARKRSQSIVRNITRWFPVMVLQKELNGLDDVCVSDSIVCTSALMISDIGWPRS